MSEPSEDQVYFNYLRGRSQVGLWYRKFYLYPRLNRMLRGRVLDFGCGIGDFLSFRRDTVGVDRNRHNVAFCRSNGHDARLIERGRIPWADAEFDGVVIDNVLEHIPVTQVDGVIGEVLRVLAPGGTLLIGVPGRKGYAADTDHKHFYRAADLEQLMYRHGCALHKTLHVPLRASLADRYLSQYCIYAAFTKPVEGAGT